MIPAPDTLHARTQNKIFTRIYNWVEKSQTGEVFCAPVDVYLNEKNIFQPDIFYIAQANKSIIQNKGIVGAPDLVIEILSDDRAYDLVRKKEYMSKVVLKNTGWSIRKPAGAKVLCCNVMHIFLWAKQLVK